MTIICLCCGAIATPVYEEHDPVNDRCRQCGERGWGWAHRVAPLRPAPAQVEAAEHD